LEIAAVMDDALGVNLGVTDTKPQNVLDHCRTGLSAAGSNERLNRRGGRLD